MNSTTKTNEMRLIIGADLVPTYSNEALFIRGDIEQLVGEDIISYLKKSDFNIFNLEAPLTSSCHNIKKNGICIKASEKCIAGYSSLGVDFLTLANNHILDYGEEGLEDTICVLNEHNIKYAGVGKNLRELRKAHIEECDGRKVGIYCCVEHEFSVATEASPGANPFEPLSIENDLKQLSDNCDYVIVLYHGGREHYRYPTPLLQKRCRKIVECGANLVVCQHSHCIGCEEEYNNGTIVYGQGNFIFDADNCDEWKTSMLIEVVDKKINYIPIVKQNELIRIADVEDKQKILREFWQRSEQIKNAEFVISEFKRYANESFYEYMWSICGGSESFILRVINKLSNYRFYKWYIKKKLPSNVLTKLLNYFICESHSEIIVESIKCRLS